MRKIKFRGQSVNGKEWVYGSLLEPYDNELPNYIHETLSIRHAIIPDTVGQFTGLTDKNGIEIYEGDIITVNSKIVKQVRINDYFLAVQVANKEDLKLIDILDPWQTPGEVWWNDFGREIIVIGNIYDNPELLQ